MSSSIASRGLALRGFRWMMLGGLLVAAAALAWQGQPSAGMVVASMGFGMLAGGYAWLANSLSRESAARKFLWAATSLECAAIALAWLGWTLWSRGEFGYGRFIYITPLAIMCHVLAFAAYLRFHVMVLPEFRYVTPMRLARAHAMVWVVALAGFASLAANELVMLIFFLSHFFAPMFPMILWLESRKLPRGDDPLMDSSRAVLVANGVFKLIVGMSIAAGCMYFLISQWRAFNDDEAIVMAIIGSLVAGAGLRWVYIGQANVRGQRPKFARGLAWGLAFALAFGAAVPVVLQGSLAAREAKAWAAFEQDTSRLEDYYYEAPRAYWRPEAVARFLAAGDGDTPAAWQWRDRRFSIGNALHGELAGDPAFDELRRRVPKPTSSPTIGRSAISEKANATTSSGEEGPPHDAAKGAGASETKQ